MAIFGISLYIGHNLACTIYSDNGFVQDVVFSFVVSCLKDLN